MKTAIKPVPARDSSPLPPSPPGSPPRRPPVRDAGRAPRRTAGSEGADAVVVAAAAQPGPDNVPNPDTAPDSAARSPLTHNEIRSIVIGIVLAMFLGALDQTIVATALPTIGRALHDVENLSWVVTAYLLVSTAVVPLYGKLSDIHGRRGMMMIGIGLFVLGSIIAALAPTMAVLVAGRAVQGLGAGGLIPLAQTIIADVVSPKERGRYQGYIGATFAFASLSGPVLGGVLAQHFHWSLIFWINLPLGAAAALMINTALRKLPRHDRPHKLDVLGSVLMMTAAASLMLALTWGGTRFPWLSVEIAGLLTVSAVLWVLFAWRLLRAPEPFLPLPVLLNPVVRNGTLSGAFNMGTLIGLTIFAPLYFEVVRGLSASESGLALIPLMGATPFASTAVGRAMMVVQHYKRMAIIGMAVGVAGIAVLAIAPATMPLWAVLVTFAVIGIGMGAMFPVSTVSVQNAVSQHQMGVATGTMNFFRSLVSALVVAALGAIILGGISATEGGTPNVSMLSHAGATGVDAAHVFRWVFIAAAGFLTCGLLALLAMEEKPLRTDVPDPVAMPATPAADPAE